MGRSERLGRAARRGTRDPWGVSVVDHCRQHSRTGVTGNFLPEPEFAPERPGLASRGRSHRLAWLRRDDARGFPEATPHPDRLKDEVIAAQSQRLFDLAAQPLGDAQLAAGRLLASRARIALDRVQTSYLTPWSSGDLRQRLMAVSVLWAMAQDDLLTNAALEIGLDWIREGGQTRAITAAIALAGPLGLHRPSEALPALLTLTFPDEMVSPGASPAIG